MGMFVKGSISDADEYNLIIIVICSSLRTVSPMSDPQLILTIHTDRTAGLGICVPLWDSVLTPGTKAWKIGNSANDLCMLVDQERGSIKIRKITK